MSATSLRSALVYTLQNAGDMEIMRLAKFLYLADYVYAKMFGNQHGFIDEHQRYPYGPVPAEFYDEYNDLIDKKVIDRKGVVVTLEKTDYEIDELSEEVKACLDKVIQDFDGSRLDDVIKSAYATEPMVEIKKKEERLGVKNGLVFTKMDFSNVDVHPLSKPVDIDLSFLDSDEYKENENQ